MESMFKSVGRIGNVNVYSGGFKRNSNKSRTQNKNKRWREKNKAKKEEKKARRLADDLKKSAEELEKERFRAAKARIDETVKATEIRKADENSNKKQEKTLESNKSEATKGTDGRNTKEKENNNINFSGLPNDSLTTPVRSKVVVINDSPQPGSSRGSFGPKTRSQSKLQPGITMAARLRQLNVDMEAAAKKDRMNSKT